MKRYVLYGVIVVLLMFIAGGTVYVIMDKKLDNATINNENKQENIKDNTSNNENNLVVNDSVKLKDTKQNGDKIVEEFEITLNGNQKSINVEFSYAYDNYFEGHRIQGTFNKYLFNESSYYNHDNSYYTKENIFNVENIKKVFNEDDFKIIKGTDNKSYLAIISERYVDSVLYIFNDKMELLNIKRDDIYEGDINERFDEYFMIQTFGNTPCEFANGINPLYDNKVLKIADNKIYYLALTNPNNDIDNAVLEERVYTINNDKLNYEVINKYNVTGVCQQI